MIWYKCDVGFSNASSLSNLNDLTFLDFDVAYPIFTTDIRPENANDFLTPFSSVYERLLSVLKDDLSVMYAYPPRIIFNGGIGYNNIKNYIPSIILGYPNSFKYAEENAAKFAVHIKKLNILIYGDNRVSSYYRVSGNNLSKITTLGFNPGGLNYESSTSGPLSAYFFGCAGYSDQNDLLNVEKMFIISFVCQNNLDQGIYRVTQLEEKHEGPLKLFFGNEPPPPDGSFIIPDNPYEPGGDSGEGGGDGTFDDDSDLIPDSSLPTLSSASTGFTRIYNPSLSQLNQLATYLWTDESIIQTIWNHAKQFFEDPMSVIIGLNIVPVPVPNGGTDNFKVLYIDTGIPLTYAASQFVDVDCGTLEIKQYYGSAIDYSPYTKISCFLPFIGTVQLNTDEVMGKTLQVKYRVDIASGSCVAKIFVAGNCIYQYSGHCAINVPISSADFSSYVSAAISVAKLAIGAAVGGGMSALAAATADPTQQTNQVVTTTQTVDTMRNPATGRQITTGTHTVTETRESPTNQSSTQASFSGLSPQNISNTVGEIMTAKPHVEHSGSFSGNTGYLGVRRPFVIIERPNMCMPKNYQQFNGFPCMITLELAECTGFTRVQQVQLTGMSATNPEQSEILELLKSGVII